MNKRNMHYIILVIAFGVSDLAVQGQAVDDFIALTLARNHKLEALQLEYQAALQQIDQVTQWPDPMVSLGLGVLPIETRLGAQHIRLGISQNIPWRKLLDAKGALAEARANVKNNLDQNQRIEIEYVVRQSYSRLLFLHKEKEIVLDRLDILEALSEMAKSALRSGKGQLSNVLLVERQREALEQDYILLDAQILQPTIALNRWAGLDLYQTILVDSTRWSLPTRDEIFNYLQESHPQQEIFSNMILLSQAEQNLNSMQSLPKLGVGLDYGLITQRSDADPAGNGRDMLMPRGSITIPLHKKQYAAKHQEEEIKQLAIHADQTDWVEAQTAMIETAFATIEYYDQMILKWQGLKDITRETLELLRSEYGSEGTRFEELLRLEMEMVDYEQKIAAANYQKRLQEAVLLKFKI